MIPHVLEVVRQGIRCGLVAVADAPSNLVVPFLAVLSSFSTLDDLALEADMIIAVGEWLRVAFSRWLAAVG